MVILSHAISYNFMKNLLNSVYYGMVCTRDSVYFQILGKKARQIMANPAMFAEKGSGYFYTNNSV